MESINTKNCSKCGIKKNIDEFSRDNRKPDGRRYRCKECTNKDIKERRYKGEAKRRFREEGVPKYTVLDEPDLKKGKLCSKCGQIKEQRHFYYDKRDSRFRSRCKMCHGVDSKASKEKYRIKKIREGV